VKPKLESAQIPSLHHSITHCSICQHKEFKSVFNLPNFPLTEQFGDFDKDFPVFDQELLLCKYCGHVQLFNILDPRDLYTPSTYAYRIPNTGKIHAEHQYFLEFILGLSTDIQKFNALEIGAGNFQLAKFLRKYLPRYSICEPLMADLNESVVEGINIIGKFAEDASSEIRSLAPDFIFGRHFLEHVVNPRELLVTLLSMVNEETIFCFEVPSLLHLRNQSRFDAIFHQHVQYYDLESISLLVNSLNCEILDFQYNSLGSNGGSLLFAFRRSGELGVVDHSLFDGIESERVRIEQKAVCMLEEIANFELNMKSLARSIELSAKPIYGFGAAHMLATLNYHLDGKIHLLDFILDDNFDLNGCHYKNIDVMIKHPSNVTSLKDSTILITSQENRRTIMNKLIQMGVSKILTTNVT
jgi:hypothetical protein